MSSRTQVFLDAGIDPGVELGTVELTTPPGEDDNDAALQAFLNEYGAAHQFEAPPAFSGWPAAVPVRPGNWDVDFEPAKYKIALGDTLAGLAATYLGSPQRWKEIWDIQPDVFRWNNSPDKIYPGQWFNMPDEARDNMLNWIKQGKPAHTKPGELPPETIGQKAKRLGPAIAAVGAAGVLGYFILRG